MKSRFSRTHIGTVVLACALLLRLEPITAAAPSVLTDNVRDAQIGEQWNRHPVEVSGLPNNSILSRSAQSTALYRGATAIYLGKWNGHHLMVTNHHVQENLYCLAYDETSGQMKPAQALFKMLNVGFPCEKVYGTWPEIDLAIFSISVSPAQENSLKGLGVF